MIKTSLWASLLMAACPASPTDDAFARSFIEHVRLRESTGVRQLEPGRFRDRGWQPLAELSGFLPQGTLDSVRLTQWKSFHDGRGKIRKLTYLLYSRTESSRAEVWIVSRRGQNYVNQIQVVGPLTTRH